MPHYPERMARMRSRSEESVLVVKDLSCRIEGRDVLSDISLSLTRGEAVAIVGENGAGKTTLIKHFNGLYQPTTGEVSFKGRCIRSLHPSARAAAVGVCLQNPNDQFFEADVRKEILAGPKRLGQVDWKWFEQICDTLSLHLLLDRSPYRLSEGEKRRVALASILIMRPDVLVLDEPTAGQDGRFKETLAHMCASISEMGTAVVVVTHDLDFARTTTDRWVVMHAGRIAADGTPEKMCEKLLSILEDTTERPLGSVADCL
jgi:energy-coupling factor transport system ATP-binding protein